MVGHRADCGIAAHQRYFGRRSLWFDTKDATPKCCLVGVCDLDMRHVRNDPEGRRLELRLPQRASGTDLSDRETASNLGGKELPVKSWAGPCVPNSSANPARLPNSFGTNDKVHYR